MPIINILQPVVWAGNMPTTASYRRRSYRMKSGTAHEQYHTGMQLLVDQLKIFTVTPLVNITTDVKTSPTGIPTGYDCEPNDVRVSIVFDLPNGDRHIIGSDAYKTTGGNLAALAKVVAALLQVEKYGSAGALNELLRAYAVTKKQPPPPPPPQGGSQWRSGSRSEDWYSASASNRGFYDPPPPPPPPPPPSPNRGLPWWVVLEVMRSAEADTVHRCYRAMAFKHHPDRGGKAEDMQAINNAYAAFKQERGIK